MVETSETKANFEAALEKARGLHPLRQTREMLGLELGNLQFNLVHLELKGKTLSGERARIEAEIAKVSLKEQDLLQELRKFFASLVNNSVLSVQERMPSALSKRRHLRALLAESATLYAELENIQKDWKREFDALVKMRSELVNQTKQSNQTEASYAITEPTFTSPWLPSPPRQSVERARTHGDNIASILEAMARQIG